MRGCREVFVGIDTAKTRNAVATAETGRQGEVRYLSEFDNTPDAVAKLVRKLGDRYETLQLATHGASCGVMVVLMMPHLGLRHFAWSKGMSRQGGPAARGTVGRSRDRRAFRIGSIAGQVRSSLAPSGSQV
jgi:hypothetical protein